MTAWTVTTSSATSLTLATTSQAYAYTGTSAATWTLPAVSGNTGIYFYLYNRGRAIVTVKRAGSDHLFNLGATATSMFLDPGTSALVFDDGTYWLVLHNTPVPPTYFVDDYGADPTGTTSSNTAVAAAVAAMGSNPGVLEFGPGNYLLSATTTLGAFQGIRGQGRGVTTITFTGSGACFRVWDQTSSGSGTSAQPGGAHRGLHDRRFWSRCQFVRATHRRPFRRASARRPDSRLRRRGLHRLMVRQPSVVFRTW